MLFWFIIFGSLMTYITYKFRKITMRIIEQDEKIKNIEYVQATEKSTKETH